MSRPPNYQITSKCSDKEFALLLGIFLKNTSNVFLQVVVFMLVSFGCELSLPDISQEDVDLTFQVNDFLYLLFFAFQHIAILLTIKAKTLSEVQLPFSRTCIMQEFKTFQSMTMLC